MNIDVTAPSGSWYGSIYYGGSWHQSEPVFIDESDVSRVFTFTGVDFTAKDGEVIILLSEGENSTLPVELSFFNAILTGQNFVKLSWISDSESNMLGYRVYRAESCDQASALMITPVMISATNTSTTAYYTHEDHEVASGATYYYWLELLDFCSSQFYGPQSVTLSDHGNDPGQPEIPLVTRLLPNYPNPFNPSTTIAYHLRTPETVTITIYNARGEMVRSYVNNHTEAGIHTLAFDGLDSNGKTISSGIYFCNMSTPTMNQTKKMLMVK